MGPARRLARHVWRQWSRADREDRRVLHEAFRTVAVARWRVRFVPFRRWAGTLGSATEESAPTVSGATTETSARVGWAVETAARYVPFEAECLVQASAAKAMLAKRDIDTTLYLGVCRDDAGAFTRAHAWLRCGEHLVTGAEGHEAFTVVSTFGPIEP